MQKCESARTRTGSTQTLSWFHVKASHHPTHLCVCAGQEDHSEERSDSLQMHANIPAKLPIISHRQCFRLICCCATPDDPQGLLRSTRLREQGGSIRRNWRGLHLRLGVSRISPVSQIMVLSAKRSPVDCSRSPVQPAGRLYFLARAGVGGGCGPGVLQLSLHPTRRLTQPLRLLLWLPSPTSRKSAPTSCRSPRGSPPPWPSISTASCRSHAVISVAAHTPNELLAKLHAA